jgi:hypothetical protein
MTLVHKRLIAAALAAAACAWLQPPKSIPSKDIVRQPRAAALPSQTTAAAPTADASPDGRSEAASTQAPARKNPPTVAELEIESRARQQQLAEAEKKAADEEARQSRLAENCERMRGYLRALEGGFRVSRVNAAGQKEVLDDAARAAERERTLAEIAQHCQ